MHLRQYRLTEEERSDAEFMVRCLRSASDRQLADLRDQLLPQIAGLRFSDREPAQEALFGLCWLAASELRRREDLLRDYEVELAGPLN